MCASVHVLRARADKSVRAWAAVGAASAFPDTWLRLFLGGYDSGGTDAERLRWSNPTFPFPRAARSIIRDLRGDECRSVQSVALTRPRSGVHLRTSSGVVCRSADEKASGCRENLCHVCEVDV